MIIMFVIMPGVRVHQVRKLADLGKPGQPRPRMGGTDGTPTAQDPGGLPVLPRHHPRAAAAAAYVVVTGERCAVKACAV